MSLTNFPSRAAVDQAADLSFATPPRRTAGADEELPITIEIAPDGVHVSVHYTGTLTSIGPTLDRMRAAGLLGLVQARPPAPAAGSHKPKAERVAPAYNAAGDPCCPVHKAPLVEGQYGLYCRSKAGPGEAQNAKGYCSLRFAE